MEGAGGEEEEQEQAKQSNEPTQEGQMMWENLTDIRNSLHWIQVTYWEMENLGRQGGLGFFD